MWGQYGATNYVCFDCRRHASSTSYGPHTCPSCRAPMINMGTRLKVPRRADVKQWEKIRLLRERSCYFICHDRQHLHAWSTEPFVKTLSDAKNRLQERRSDRKAALEPEKVPKRSNFGYKAIRGPR